jgi:hypothetical protein
MSFDVVVHAPRILLLRDRTEPDHTDEILDASSKPPSRARSRNSSSSSRNANSSEIVDITGIRAQKFHNRAVVDIPIHGTQLPSVVKVSTINAVPVPVDAPALHALARSVPDLTF